MVELRIGEPSAWLPDSAEADSIREAGRQLLDACLPSRQERDALYTERWAIERAPGS